MRENAEIFQIITNYFSGEISAEEQQKLDEWLRNPANKQEFKMYAKANYLSVVQPQRAADAPDSVMRLWSNNLVKIAAVLVLLLAVGAVWKLSEPEVSLPSNEFVSVSVNGKYKVIDYATDQTLVTDDHEVQLARLENGTLKLLKNTAAKSIIINVPNGKNLKVLLTDGTEILLNAGTQISFNTNLVQDRARKVGLKGQAFFEVAKDERHPFYVSTEKFTTKVLGTKFNISSYKNERESFVNLVEGKIEVSAHQLAASKILTPGQKISFSPEMKTPIVEAAKPEQDMDWLNKEIAFENNTTEEVLSKIERVYGLQIVRNRIDVEDFHFSGTFKIENLDQITHSLEALLDCKIRKDGRKLILISKN